MNDFVNIPIFQKQSTMREPISMPSIKRNLKRASTLFTKIKLPTINELKSLNLPPIRPQSPRNNQSPTQKQKIPNAKVSQKPHGSVFLYAGCTAAGSRALNEDRVVMINTTLKPSGRICSYFAIFDGFSGKFTCNYLRDNLHIILTKHPLIESNTGKAISESFEEAERQIMAHEPEKRKNSGACALVTVVIDKFIFVANLGSSRCYLSSIKGFEKSVITKDHLITDEEEKKRVLNSGGEVVKMHGSFRVRPGNLKVTRCFGCAEAKQSGAVIVQPEIKSSKIRKKMDFLLMTSDGVWSVMNKYEVSNTVWEVIDGKKGSQVEKVGRAVRKLLKNAVRKGSDDNVSAILVGFDGLSHLI